MKIVSKTTEIKVPEINQRSFELIRKLKNNKNVHGVTQRDGKIILFVFKYDPKLLKKFKGFDVIQRIEKPIKLTKKEQKKLDKILENMKPKPMDVKLTLAEATIEFANNHKLKNVTTIGYEKKHIVVFLKKDEKVPAEYRGWKIEKRVKEK